MCSCCGKEKSCLRVGLCFDSGMLTWVLNKQYVERAWMLNIQYVLNIPKRMPEGGVYLLKFSRPHMDRTKQPTKFAVSFLTFAGGLHFGLRPPGGIAAGAEISDLCRL